MQAHAVQVCPAFSGAEEAGGRGGGDWSAMFYPTTTKDARTGSVGLRFSRSYESNRKTTTKIIRNVDTPLI